ncbi:iron-containing alcohol dehydrogenase [Mangrovibacterium marinum]|uniref:NADP-dependent alcohol dehydrogenase n=1 Tax=Mangrovibacterium marinum TaxID=1639118 RepID=A0A2T5C582_9BACT|nr:iron-containing alcohol dehydrogenase [Mangrovibacterium marinum]PTN10042.1 NADP-dependent alcohol dehydrogenase [Mangrovibacterium marinum]
MNNFTFQNPVKVLFGKGQIAQIREQLPANSKILLTYGGGSIFKNGVYQQVKEATNGFNILEFGGIEANPKFETLMKAVAICKDEQIDYLLAVGGGSVLDGTKFIAAAVCFEGADPWDILAKQAEVKAALPIGAVLTLPATGSEMNGNSVVSRIETQEKLAFGSPMVMPQFSVLDPEVIFSLPDRQVANGVVDAFVHVMEQYLTYPVNAPLQDRMAEGILHTLIEEGPKVLANRNDYDAAANFMWSATMALNGLIAVGVPQDWATHLIGHELTAYHGIDHARTLAIVLPGMMDLKRENKEAKLLQYGERIWGINQGTTNERIDAAIAKTVEFFESVGIKTKLPDYDVPSETIGKIAERFEQRGYKVGEHGDIGPKEVSEILESRL